MLVGLLQVSVARAHEWTQITCTQPNGWPQQSLRDKSAGGRRNRGGDGFVWRILTTNQAKPRPSAPPHGPGAASSRTPLSSRAGLESSTNGCSITLANSAVFASAVGAGD
jgi:hypothetical protein